MEDLSTEDKFKEIKQKELTALINTVEPIKSTKRSTEDRLDELFSLIVNITDQTKTPAVPITSTTKRIIAGGIFAINIIVAIGWATKGIDAKDALLIISSSITGGFALLRL